MQIANCKLQIYNSTIQQEMRHVSFLTSTCTCQWKNCNSTNQQRLELIHEIFQVFASGKLSIQQINSVLNSYLKKFKLLKVENLQFNREWGMIDIKEIQEIANCKLKITNCKLQIWQWKIGNSTIQRRIELIYKKFQAFESGKFAIQQFNGE